MPVAAAVEGVMDVTESSEGAMILGPFSSQSVSINYLRLRISENKTEAVRGMDTEYTSPCFCLIL